MNSIIETRNVCKYYEVGDTTVKALDGVDIKIREGEFVSIIGQSGSGKTTLLDVISCLLRPTKGEVLIEDKPISKMNDNELAQVRGKTIGFVFQSFNLLPRLNCIENVALPLWFQDVEKKEREERAITLLKKVGLEDRMLHKPTELSGGQKQRVAIARALAVNPRIIVADEPTGNLDSASGQQILETLIDLHEKHGKTIVMVTHEKYIAEHAERIISIKDGRIDSDVKNGNRRKLKKELTK